MKKSLLAFLFFITCLQVFSQSKPTFEVSTRGIISKDSIKPFWTRANQYGTVPLSGNLFATALTVQKSYDSLYTRDQKLSVWGFGYGFEGHLLNNDGQTQFILPQLYAKVRWKHFEVYAGRQREVFGIVDTMSTSGSYIWSGNALPMPKVQIHTPDYLPLIKSGFLAVKAGISHGWFDDNGVVSGHFLHQKWLYGRIGKSDSKVQFTAGLNHQVQWGGYSDILKDVGGQFPPTIDGYLAPEPWYSYQYILLPFLQKLRAPDPNKVPGYDGGLAIGNQLGSVDLGFKVLLTKSTVLIYMQQPYDFARSLYNLNNIQDGLYGLSFTTPTAIVNKVCFEFFDSRSQGRYRFGQYRPSNYGEVDSYFFHGQYQSWSYNNLIIGNPFIIERHITGEGRFNNRLRYYYLNMKGSFGKVAYVSKYVFSQNNGTYGKELNLNQQSINLDLSRQLNRHFTASIGFSIDRGYLYPNNEGIDIRLNYQF